MERTHIMISLCKFKSDLHMDRQTLYFTVAIVSPMIKQYTKKTTRTKTAATERDWRLPSSPIVWKKHVVSLRKLKGVLIYTWIAKPLFLPLQFFPNDQTPKLAATERDWRLPSSPTVEKNMWFSYVNSTVYWFTHGSPNPYFYRCKFVPNDKTIHFFRQLERNSPQLSETGGSRRRQ